MEHIPIEWVMEVPPITRSYTGLILLTSALEYIGMLSPYDCFFSVDKIFSQNQYYRLVTSFLYFGELNFDLLFKVFFITRSLKTLEESVGRTRDFAWFLLVNCVIVLLYSASLNNQHLLGPCLDDVLMYVWSKHEGDMQVGILGIVHFNVVYLPWVYMFFNVLANRGAGLVIQGEPALSVKTVIMELLMRGIVLGHTYYFLNDVLPKIHGEGWNIVRAPWYHSWWSALFATKTEEEENGDGN
ncbi:hypothetical protein BABINDRAFT_10440 [Babjeviella inositovora NRRL Y-12698]|uniref:Derlin n=1 Tax=Babjeviella inositovora NRRL Y-12698 TaxID=984486 RepID=A0A1E3QH95_9ASCO|nr:uncharacterized protein BABINDRAFT_10440 [Babjeviella inositovora NRRL Y-12698]ODQ77069.1 hypothetical protein BABINDRAFT_10440 [Babjeviella inositovora NRRL Y-12698]